MNVYSKYTRDEINVYIKHEQNAIYRDLKAKIWICAIDISNNTISFSHVS